MPGVKAQSPRLPLVSPNYLGFHHPHPTVTGDSDGSRGGAGPPPIKHLGGAGLEERGRHLSLVCPCQSLEV